MYLCDSYETETRTAVETRCRVRICCGSVVELPLPPGILRREIAQLPKRRISPHYLGGTNWMATEHISSFTL